MTLAVVIIVALILFVVMMYNGMIKLRNRVKEAWSDIDVQLKRRYNLIPNIVESVKGYAAHEEGVFTKVTEARSNAINATNIKDQGAAENMLSSALKSLFAVAENYPDLKANENFLQLQNELVDTEDKIQSARRFYNSVTRDFNTKIQQFPNSLIAKAFKFEEEEFFEIEEEEQRENVEVSFNKETPTETPAPATPVAEEAMEEEEITEEVTPATAEPVTTPTEEIKTEEPTIETPAPTATVVETPIETTPEVAPAPEEPQEEKLNLEENPEPDEPIEQDKSVKEDDSQQ